MRAPRARAFERIVVVLLVGTASACGDDAVAPSDDDNDGPVPVVPSVATAWLDTHVLTFDSLPPADDVSDLAFLRDMVGEARVVALGEATHGTHEFHVMKARILRYLVEEMGFTALAVEASWPEGNRLDAYVRTGVGEPTSLLSGLYFWVIRSQAVLDLIAWMRAANAAGTPVGFYGFDMQYPGMALENIVRFVAEEDPDVLPAVEAHLGCMHPFVNGPDAAIPLPGYETLPLEERNACHADLSWVHDTLAAMRDDLSSHAGTDAFERALRSARLLVQFEEMSSGRRARDDAMAENALWLLDRLGSGGKLVLWAHNEHVAANRNRMGQRLREALGDDFVTIGFTFAYGSFNARLQSGSTYYEVQELSAPPPPDDSYEAYFLSAHHSRFALDLRGRASTSDSTAWLHGPHLYRFIGAGYNRNWPERYFVRSDITVDFDAVVYFRDTTPTWILPWTPPDSFYP